MLGDEKNGNDTQEESKDLFSEKMDLPLKEAPEAVKEEGVKEEKKPDPSLNSAWVDGGVMTIKLYLEGADNAFACAIGSLVLAQDMVKNHFTQKALADAAIRSRTTLRIIKPTLS